VPIKVRNKTELTGTASGSNNAPKWDLNTILQF